MKTDFEHWLAAQFTDIGPFANAVPMRSSYAHLIGDEMTWQEMRMLLDGARAPWDGVAFFIGLGNEGGPLPDPVAARKLKEVEADVKADPLTLNRGLFFDREGRHLRIDETTA